MAVSEYIKDICKIGQGADCCRYLAMQASGFVCMKVRDDLKELIDDSWVRTQRVAQGDNCEGKEDLNG